jgi:SSS family solute:Na+ symporter
MNGVALAVFVFFFGLVTVIGFVAARWRSADLGHLNEWGLGGRSFGTIITWFLLGGDLYTAYTFIAVPALVFGVGALGFFALPYTIIVYPFVFLVMPRLWSVAHKHQYVTPSDFVRGRYGSRGLSLAVAATGILATMPYIACSWSASRSCCRAWASAAAAPAPSSATCRCSSPSPSWPPTPTRAACGRRP